MSTLSKIGLSIIIGMFSITTVGCASGGFKLTRKAAQFVNKQNIFVRIILYILLGGIIFPITALIDAVIFNTIDFWEGKVSANQYRFEKEGKIFVVDHKFVGKEKLKRSEIQIFAPSETPSEFLNEVKSDTPQKPETTIVIAETKEGKVEVFKNGIRTSELESIDDVATVTMFDDKGKLLSRHPLQILTAAR